MTTADVLNQAADLVAKGWVQGRMAINANGKVVDSRDENACAFCAAGAILHVAGLGDLYYAAHDEVRALIPGWDSIAEWQDQPRRTQLAVVRKLRAAAKRADV